MNLTGPNYNTKGNETRPPPPIFKKFEAHGLKTGSRISFTHGLANIMLLGQFWLRIGGLLALSVAACSPSVILELYYPPVSVSLCVCARVQSVIDIPYIFQVRLVWIYK